MNIFILDKDNKKSAEYYCDKHVVKIISEITQMCTSALNRAGVSSELFPKTLAGTPLKVTHVNHPVTRWVGDSQDNYVWAVEMLDCLCSEYTYRYNKNHHYSQFIYLLMYSYHRLPNIGRTNFPPAMPPQFKKEDIVESYRSYYRLDKMKTIQCKWTKRNVPEWILQ